MAIKDGTFMSICITSDSVGDFTPEQLRRYQIEVLPLTINLADRAYLDGVEMTPEQIFRHVDAGGDLPKTSAVSVQQFHDLFARLSPLHEAVINVDTSPVISACYQNASIAAQDFDNVYVLDSGSLSAGQGLVAIAGAQAAQQGLSGKEVYEYMRQYAAKVETTFTLDGLRYLHKGGRCSGVAVFGANLLKIKPCIIQAPDGALTVGKKYRGTFAKVLREYIKDRIVGRQDIDLTRCFVVHAGVNRELVDMTMEEVAGLAPFQEITEIRTGCTIASHCGPDTLGVMFARK